MSISPEAEQEVSIFSIFNKFCVACWNSMKILSCDTRIEVVFFFSHEISCNKNVTMLHNWGCQRNHERLKLRFYIVLEPWFSGADTPASASSYESSSQPVDGRGLFITALSLLNPYFCWGFHEVCYCLLVWSVSLQLTGRMRNRQFRMTCWQ